MRPGFLVEVQSRFDGSWVRGFEVAEVRADRGREIVRVRRSSDGVVLPAYFQPEEVRELKPV